MLLLGYSQFELLSLYAFLIFPNLRVINNHEFRVSNAWCKLDHQEALLCEDGIVHLINFVGVRVLEVTNVGVAVDHLDNWGGRDCDENLSVLYAVSGARGFDEV